MPRATITPHVERASPRGPFPGLSASPKGAVESVTELGFKGSQAGVQQLAFRHDDDVEARGEFVATENLSNQSFGSISVNRSAELLRRGNPQPADP